MISWYGGKATISKFILENVPKDIETFVEPFSGMLWCVMKMDFNQFPNLKTIVYNDINPLNVNLFRCVKEHETLYKYMLEYPCQKFGVTGEDPTEYIELFNKCQKRIYDPNFKVDLNSTIPDFETACDYLYTLCHTFSGTNPEKGKYIFYKGRYMDKFLIFLKRITEKKWIEHFNRITHIECLDACDVIKKYDSPTTYHYVDAPYFGHSKDYSNHPFTDKDHTRVANCLKNISGKCGISYYEFPELYELYPPGNKWRWEKKEFSKSAAASKGKKTPKSVELLIMNYELIDRTKIIEKWEKSGLLDGLDGMSKTNIADQLQCCKDPKRLNPNWKIDLEIENASKNNIDLSPAEEQVRSEIDDQILKDVMSMTDEEYDKIKDDLKNAQDPNHPDHQKSIDIIKNIVNPDKGVKVWSKNTFTPTKKDE